MDQETNGLLNHLLIFGTVLGFPILSVHKQQSSPKRFLNNLAGCCSIFVAVGALLVLIVCAINLQTNKSSKTGKLNDLLNINYNLGAFNIYLYLLWNRRNLRNILRKVFDVQNPLRIPRTDNPLSSPTGKPISVYCALIILIGTEIFEAVSFDLDINRHEIDILGNATFFEKNFHVTMHDLKVLKAIYPVFCRPYIMFICYVIPKITTFAIIYGDILCIVISYKISSKLYSIKHQFEGQLQLNVICSTTKSKHIAELTSIRTNYDSNITWQTVYNEISEIRKLTTEASKFLSPVLLISLMVYVFTLVQNLDQIFNPNDVMFDKMKGISIFLTLSHYAMRVIFLVHFASGVYQASQRILLKIEDSFEELAAQKSEHLDITIGILQRKSLGITFFDTFVITREFYVKIITFLFSTEIILLQASTGGNFTNA